MVCKFLFHKASSFYRINRILKQYVIYKAWYGIQHITARNLRVGKENPRFCVLIYKVPPVDSVGKEQVVSLAIMSLFP